MGIIIVKNVFKKHGLERKKGCLYYIDGEGNLCEAEMKRGRKKKK